MFNRKKWLTIGTVNAACLFGMPLIAHAAPSKAQLAQTCKDYLTGKKSVSAKGAEKTLASCVSNLSCSNPVLKGIHNCAYRLNNLSTQAQLSSVKTTKLNTKTTTNNKVPAKKTSVIKPLKPVYHAPSNEQIKRQPQNQTTTKKTKKLSINWF